jgi:hypothetical protein
MLYRCRMLMKQEKGLIYLSGRDTWVWKELMNRLGATWSKSNSSWVIENFKNDNRFVAYIYNFLNINDVKVVLGEGIDPKACRIMKEEGLETLKNQLKDEGYFGGRPAIPKSPVEQVAELIAQGEKERREHPKSKSVISVMFYNFNEPFKKTLLSNFGAQKPEQLGWDKTPVFILVKQERQ